MLQVADTEEQRAKTSHGGLPLGAANSIVGAGPLEAAGSKERGAERGEQPTSGCWMCSSWIADSRLG
jgi:hypothetical protein